LREDASPKSVNDEVGSHIRTEAKRDALETVARRRRTAEEELRQEGEAMPNITQGFERESLQKSLQSCRNGGEKGESIASKSLNLNGGRGRNRTYNLSVKRGKRTICTKLHRVA
jgi:hypothetical protein